MTDTELNRELQPVLEGLDLTLVSCRQQVVNRRLHVQVVVHRPGGVSVSDCSAVHRTVQPRISLLTGRRDIHMEVSSPGIGRKLKSPDDYVPFIGSRIQILPHDGEWIAGLLEAADNRGIELNCEGTLRRLEHDTIRVGKLDDQAPEEAKE